MGGVGLEQWIAGLEGARYPLQQSSDRSCYGVTIYSNVSIESTISLPQLNVMTGS